MSYIYEAMNRVKEQIIFLKARNRYKKCKNY